MPDRDVLRSLKNIENGKVNQGENSFIAIDGYKYPTFEFDFFNFKTSKWERLNVNMSGVETGKVKRNSREKSRKAKSRKAKSRKGKGGKGKRRKAPNRPRF